MSNLSAAARRCQGERAIASVCGAVRQGNWLYRQTDRPNGVAARLAGLVVITQSRSFDSPPRRFAAGGTPPRPDSRASSLTELRYGYAGGDDDSGIPPRGLRRRGEYTSPNSSPNCGGCARWTCIAWAHRGRAPRECKCTSLDPRLQGANPAMTTLSADLMMASAASAATVVHSHTWYTSMAGHLAALLYDVPHVLMYCAFARAAPAPVEGRATRRWLPDLHLGRAHRGPGRRRRHRGQFRDARRTSCACTPRWIPAPCTSSAMASTPCLVPRRLMQTGSMLAESSASIQPGPS